MGLKHKLDAIELKASSNGDWETAFLEARALMEADLTESQVQKCLEAPGVTRLKEWHQVGPVQRAAVFDFARHVWALYDRAEEDDTEYLSVPQLASLAMRAESLTYRALRRSQASSLYRKGVIYYQKGPALAYLSQLGRRQRR